MITFKSFLAEASIRQGLPHISTMSHEQFDNLTKRGKVHIHDVTEKTDGQNLMISYSVKDGRAKGVRNKSEIKAGGLNPEQLAAKFADRANPALKETFADALKAFERAVHSLSHEEQIEIFGPDTNIFYNAEVMDPRAPNVINYDTKALVIHRAGHFEFDRKTNQPTGENQ